MGLTSRVLAAALAALFVGAVPVRAAEIKVGHPYDEMVIEGSIERGDAEKIRAYIESHDVGSVYLASPGGDLAEALKIGRLVRSLDLETTVPGKETPQLRAAIAKNHHIADQQHLICASACFFVFVAGVHREMDLTPFEEPILGIHRPFFSDADLRGMEASDAMAATSKVRSVVDAYLKEMDVPSKYLDRMYAIDKDKIEWIAADAFKADLDGYVPGLKDWMAAKCDKRTDIEKMTWDALATKLPADMTPQENAVAQALLAKMNDMSKCEMNNLEGLAIEAKMKVMPDAK